MDQFWADWKTPPKAFRPLVRWWWPGLDVTNEELTREVADLDTQGFGGAEIQAFLIGSGLLHLKPELAHRFAPNPYYYEMLEAVLQEARARNLTIDLTIGSSWPAGSTTVTKEDSLQTLLMGTAIIQGPRRIHMPVPAFQANPYYKYKIVRSLGSTLGFWSADFKPLVTIAVRPLRVAKKLKFFRPKAVPLDFASAIDITQQVDEAGILQWDVPEGKWQIFTIYAGPTAMTPMSSAKSAPDATSLVVDPFNEDALRRYLDRQITPGRDLLAPYLGKTLRAFFTDSLEIACEWYWTKDFFAEFERRRGYDVRPFLPVGFVPNRDNQFTYVFFMNTKPCFDFPNGVGERIRYDWEQTLSDLFAERYCGGVSRWGKQFGIQHRIQVYGIRVDLLKAYGHADIPETEQLFAGGLLDFLKLAGSAGLIYNKPVVSCESLVWMGRDYMTTPLKWKVAVDRLFIAGINQVVYHGYPYSHPDAPYPGYYPWSPPNFSSNLNCNDPFWQYFPLLNAYVTRAQYLLRQGTTQCNIGIYYPHWNYDHKCLVEEDLYGGYLAGFDGTRPKGPVIWFLRRVSNAMDKLTRTQQELGHQLMQQGYYYVHVNEEVILTSSVRDGKLQAGSAALEVIIFPNITRISLPLAHKLKEISNAGVRVVFFGEFPEGQPGYHNYEENDAHLHDILKEMLGKGVDFIEKRTDVGNYARATLKVVPGLSFSSPSPTIFYICKDTPAGRLYFVRHAGAEPLAMSIGFPVTGVVPYILDLWTGEVNQAVEYAEEKGITNVMIRFTAYGSFMLLFPKGQVDTKLPHIAPIQFPVFRQGENLVYYTWDKSTPLPINILTWHLVVQHRKMNGEINRIEMALTSLRDWRKIKALRYSNSPGTYTSEVVLDSHCIAPDTLIVLQLGRVHDIAVVYVNGQPYPPLLVPPYQVDITRAVHTGVNVIEVTVTGTLRNLLIGYGKQGGRAWRHHRRRGLMPLGLIGPVKVEVVKVLPYFGGF